MENLKTYLLEKIGFLNEGFTGVFLDSLTGKLISYSGEEIGLSDKNGSYFYIRERGDQTYRVVQKSAPKIVETLQDYRIFVFAGKINAQEARRCLLNALFFYKNIQVIGSSVNAGYIISQEYPKKKDSERLQILKNLNFGTVITVDFKMLGEIVPNDCRCEICETC